MKIEEEVDKRQEELTKRVTGYPFAKYVYRLQNEAQIKNLFGNPKELKPKTNVYYGKVEGIDVAIYFSFASNPSIHTKTQEDFNKLKGIYERKFTALK